MRILRSCVHVCVLALALYLILLGPSGSIAAPGDIDDDGVPDGIDNCPSTYNPGQTDGDVDTYGDPCDNCPDLYNPSEQETIPISIGDTYFSALTPGGTRVILEGDADLDGDSEVLAVNVASGAAIELNNPLPTGQSAYHIGEVGPTGFYVTILEEIDPNGNVALFVAQITGGTPTQLSPVLAPSSLVLPLFSPDSSRVVYRAVQDTTFKEIYSVPVSGGTPTKLSQGASVVGFEISPDSSRVVYTSEQDTPGQREIYSVPITGGTPVKLNDTMIPEGDLSFIGSSSSFVISPDSTRVIYKADADIDGVLELFSVPIGGGTVTKLHPDRGVGESVQDFRIAPGGARLVYQAFDPAVAWYELYSVDLLGAGHTRLDSSISRGNARFNFSNDGATVVYLADEDTANVFEVYTIPITGGASTKKSESLIMGGNAQWAEFSPDDSTVLYAADQEVDNRVELYAVPSFGPVVKLNRPLDPNEIIIDLFEVSQDSSTVVYHITRNAIGEELFSVPITGGIGRQLNGAEGSAEFEITGNGIWTIYVGNDLNTYRAPLVTDRDGDAILDHCDVCPLVSDPNQSDRDVDAAGDLCDTCPDLYNPSEQGTTKISIGNTYPSAVALGGTRVILNGDADLDGDTEVYSVLSTGGAPIELSNTGLNAYTLPSQVSPSGVHILITQEVDPNGSKAIFLAEATGGTPLQVTPVYPRNATVGARFSPDSNWILYSTYHAGAEFDGLYSLPITGGTTTKLAAWDGDVGFSHEVSPDSSTVVYTLDQDTTGQMEIYSIPIAGGASVKLNGPLIPEGDLSVWNSGWSFRISPDSSRVVYKADQDIDEVLELYSVPITGGTVTKLHPDRSVGQSVGDFRIAPGGARLVYLMTSLTLGWYELYSVDLFGAGHMRLDSALSRGAAQFDISPDGATVAYMADEDIANTFEIYTIPIIGGSSTKQSGPLVVGGNAQAPRFTPDGSTVLYVADAETDTQYEIYAASMGSVVNLNGPLDPNQIVYEFEVSHDSSTVVYGITQNTLGVSAFSVPITGGTARQLNGPEGATGPGTITYSDDRVIYVGLDNRGYSAPLLTDREGDAIVDYCDVCPLVSDPNQENGDPDPYGDACDCVDDDGTVYPGAPQLCDGLNNDCSDPGYPALPADEANVDGDPFMTCEGDCVDDDGTIYPGAPQLCDGKNNDCYDPGYPMVPPSEVDYDLDTWRECEGDCEFYDATVYPGAPQLCDGKNNDCYDPGYPMVPPSEADYDMDYWMECQGDCDDSNSNTFPGAFEWNDGVDNQCQGDPGYGVADELSSESEFILGTPDTMFCWLPQGGATQYQIVRSTSPEFSGGCTTFTTAWDSCLADPDSPPPDQTFHYRVRPLAPYLGSWGQDSTGTEVTFACGAEVICDDGQDDDGDGAPDCRDADCAGRVGCGVGVDISSDMHVTWDVEVYDVDLDGKLDVIAANSGGLGSTEVNRLYRNNGTSTPWAGVYGEDITSDTGSSFSARMVDVTLDGIADLLIGNASSEFNLYYPHNGSYLPWYGVNGIPITEELGSTFAIAVGDVDGVYGPDVVAGNFSGNFFYPHNGTSSPWIGVTGVPVGSDIVQTWDLDLGDVDGDGDLDVVTGNLGATNRLYLNNGTTTPWSGVVAIDITVDIHDTREVALGDVDGDNDLDLVVANSGQPNRLYLNNGTANPWLGVSGIDIETVSDNSYSVALGDVDGDGDLDMVIGNGLTTNRLYVNNGTSNPWSGVTGIDITSDADDSRGLRLADVDGLGDLDLVVGNINGRNRFYRSVRSYITTSP